MSKLLLYSFHYNPRPVLTRPLTSFVGKEQSPPLIQIYIFQQKNQGFTGRQRAAGTIPVKQFRLTGQVPLFSPFGKFRTIAKIQFLRQAQDK